MVKEFLIVNTNTNQILGNEKTRDEALDFVNAILLKYKLERVDILVYEASPLMWNPHKKKVYANYQYDVL